MRPGILQFAALALAAMLQTSAVAQQMVTIPGRVIVDNDGPLPQFGADARGPMLPLHLSLARPIDMRFLLQRDGTFLAQLPAGRYSLSPGGNIADRDRVAAFTYGSVDVLKSSVTIQADDPHELVMHLKPPPGSPAKLSGRFSGVSAMSAQERQSLRVFAFARGDNLERPAFPVETDLRPDGSFEFLKLFPGSYSVQIPNVTTPLILELAGREISNIVLIPLPPDSPNAPRVPISWQVEVDEAFPAPDFEIFLTGTISQRPANSYPEADGTYRTYAQKGEYRIRMAPLPPTYQLKAITSGAADLLKEPMKLNGPEPTVIVVRAAVTQPDEWLTLRSTVRGMENLPLPSAEAVLEISEQSTSTMRILAAKLRSDGSFEPKRVLPGDYRLALHVREADGSFPVVLYKTIHVSKENNPVVDIEIPKAATIRGRIVVDANQPRPCLSLSVGGDPRTFKLQCQPDGTFTALLPVGEYKVQAWGFPMGYYWIKSLIFGDTNLLQQNLRIPASAAQQMTVVLGVISDAHWGSVRGKVAGTPVRNSKIQIFAQNGGHFEAPVQADGSFTFPKLLPGNYSAGELTFTVFDQRVTEIEVRP